MNYRLLVVDDEAKILDYYRNILQPSDEEFQELDELEAMVLGEESESDRDPLLQFLNHEARFEVDYVDQGAHAVERVARSLQQGQPYAVVLMDVRMPPGIDGLEASQRIRQLDPNVQIFIVTAYADYSVEEILKSLNNDVLVLKKPFYQEDMLHFVANAIKSWRRVDRVAELKWQIACHDCATAALESRRADFQELESLTIHNKSSGLLDRGQLLQQYHERMATHQPFTLLRVTLQGVEEAFQRSGFNASDHLIAICLNKIGSLLPSPFKSYDFGSDQLCILVDEPLSDALLASRIENALYFIFSPEMLKIHVSASLQLYQLPTQEAEVTPLIEADPGNEWMPDWARF